jgi:hypothetical protein
MGSCYLVTCHLLWSLLCSTVQNCSYVLKGCSKRCSQAGSYSCVWLFAFLELLAIQRLVSTSVLCVIPPCACCMWLVSFLCASPAVQLHGRLLHLAVLRFLHIFWCTRCTQYCFTRFMGEHVCCAAATTALLLPLIVTIKRLLSTGGDGTVFVRVNQCTCLQLRWSCRGCS